MRRYFPTLPKISLKTAFTHLKNQGGITLNSHLQVIFNVRKGDKFSRLGRHIFEFRRIKALLGIQFALAAIIIPAAGPSFAPAKADPVETTLIVAPQVLTTESPAIRYPVENPQLSQGYFFFHPALDLRGPLGTPIYPIMAGQVVFIQYSKTDYGNHVIISHTNGYQSLYAHLSRIDVHEGDLVTTKTVIGLMGATGHATGNHLHLEIYQDGKIINPKTLLGNLTL